MNHDVASALGPLLTAYSLVGRGDHILVVRDRQGSSYQLPGTVVRPGETVDDALRRALGEHIDTGIDHLDFCAAVEHRVQIHPDGQSVYEVTLLFDVTLSEPVSVTAPERELRWVDDADLGIVDLRPAAIANLLRTGAFAESNAWWPSPA